jgi:adenosylhomocysteine nucleosidase
MSTLVCFALKEEAAPFHQIAAGRPGIFTLIVGIGQENAGKSVRSFLAACSPDRVVTCGFAGGLNPGLKLGDVIFELPGGGAPAPGDPLVRGLLAAGAKPGKFFCADRIATTVAEKRALRGQTGADAVEMESGAIHAVCRERKLPCVTLRAISDPADEDLPLDFNVLAKPDRSLDFGKLAWAIAKSPGKIPQLMRLQKKTKLAAERLAAVLANSTLLPPVC